MGCLLPNHFASIYPGAVTTNLGSSGLIACSSTSRTLSSPAIWTHKNSNRGHCCDRSLPSPQRPWSIPCRSSREIFKGDFAFMLFDCTQRMSSLLRPISFFLMSLKPYEERVLLYLVWSGLRSFEFPLNELKPVPKGGQFGSGVRCAFQRWDSEAKKEGAMPRVGSVQKLVSTKSERLKSDFS
ncbi:hypothetical protein HID58_094807 [Brassica napus]|uniref:Uncharacterized protein n=1 Tax=Brassica napus TaxID=3708 RepID=A0ABQ7X5Y5_BRANA|nr:hypothetical protein HID58_094807 [Brassica napus]